MWPDQDPSSGWPQPPPPPQLARLRSDDKVAELSDEGVLVRRPVAMDRVKDLRAVIFCYNELLFGTTKLDNTNMGEDFRKFQKVAEECVKKHTSLANKRDPTSSSSISIVYFFVSAEPHERCIEVARQLELGGSVQHSDCLDPNISQPDSKHIPADELISKGVSVVSDCTPHQKAQVVEGIQKECKGKVMYIGKDSGDVLAFQGSDVSLCYQFPAHDPHALSEVDGILVKPDWRPIERFFEVATSDPVGEEEEGPGEKCKCICAVM
uniref:Uncharacterized protein n=1 Tax=Chromera velia CCMP2878 TaxID=1169474 RepID=A0A0G4F920_9ALVE|eukprot:Cvel_15706.t1-p1 / transcript=Cvel_15706.t1 / gene=Cvel_15706 / organism=Chromera_velia_CCMP2878 / gene_product=hypothetical protein / transcript_product=hypothetical protein / location=Cvel_scaffold1173:49826-50620(+) / protein_length=265 / sequence_SO=supercontig / SO=protein_coding / is_pseudo=false